MLRTLTSASLAGFLVTTLGAVAPAAQSREPIAVPNPVAQDPFQRSTHGPRQGPSQRPPQAPSQRPPQPPPQGPSHGPSQGWPQEPPQGPPQEPIDLQIDFDAMTLDMDAFTKDFDDIGNQLYSAPSLSSHLQSGRPVNRPDPR